KGNPHMNLANQLLVQIDNPGLSRDERANLRCQLSKVLEESGNYEAARAAMNEFWQAIGEHPTIENLDQATAAEVLLRAGVLTGWIGSVEQIQGAQETAKNLITESITKFETLGNVEKIGEAQADLAHCYWREGAFDNARDTFQEALSRLTGTNSELRAITLLRSAVVEKVSNRLHDALLIYTEAAPLFAEIDNHGLKGKFHNSFANLLENLGRTEHREDYTDHALIEYTAASFHFEQAGNTRYHGCVENNLGFLFCTLDKFSEAHEHLDRAQALFTSLKDSVHLAQVDETRARVYLAEGRVADAEKLVRAAVQVLEKGGEQALFAEALRTHGKALARLGRHQQAQLTLQQALEVAQQAGDAEGAGQAALTMIEELAGRLNDDDLKATYEQAADLLSGSQHPGIVGRLHECARKALHLLVERPAPTNWEGFSLKDEVRRYERRFIERALEDTKGSVTRAAHLLGLKHQTLIALLNSRHRNLLHIRKPITPRRRSIIRYKAGSSTARRAMEKGVAGVTILHVEDNKLVSDAVRDTLKMEGWRVELCANAEAAWRKLESNAHYDLLLFDNDLPGLSGVELARRARRLAHRRRTPIVMLSAVNCAREALAAGVNLFLRKPEDVLRLAKALSGLLADKSKEQ
ncbi:MAG TPA: tetratricopeptide repeat protein, partial [Pyrinomonadaceae bacterium]